MISNTAVSGTDWAVDVEGLSRHFGRVRAIDDLTLKIPRGCVFGLLGANGAGKTTLLKLLMGHLRPTAGRFALLGRTLERDLVEIRRRVGYVSEERYLYDWMTPREILRFARAFRSGWDDAKVMQLARRFDLPLDQRIRDLSRGHRARLCLLLALAHSPELILLDEPTSGLDPVANRDFRESLIRELASRDRTVVLSSHDVEEIERIADYVGILHRGRLLVGARLDDVRNSFTRVRVDAMGDSRDLKRVPGVVAVSSFEHEQILVIRDMQPSTLEMLRGPGRFEPELLPMSLEEIFLAAVTERDGLGEWS